MVTERPYRNTFTKEEALEELKRNAGTQFDPEVVKIFVESVALWEESEVLWQGGGVIDTYTTRF